MAIDAVDTLTNIGPSDDNNRWSPRYFKAYQLRDYLDFRFDFGSRNVSVMRLLANRDTHLYGELALHDGAIRCFDVCAITSILDGRDILSLRKGPSEGEEVFRFYRDSTFTILSDEVERFKFESDSTLTITGSSTNDPTIVFVNSGADNWSISTNSSDEMELTNVTQTKTLTIGSDGNVETDGYFVIKTSAAPPSGGETGALYLEADEDTLWVKNGATWKGVVLVAAPY